MLKMNLKCIIRPQYLIYLLVYLIGTTSIAYAADPAVISNNLRNILLSEEYTEVPIRLADHSNALLIDITPANGNPQTLILDTGAAFSTISQHLANQLGAKYTGESKKMGGGGGVRAKAYKAIAPVLKIADFISHNEAFYISQKGFSYIRIDKHPIAGLLGLDYLMKHQAILDITGLRLYLKPMDIYEDEQINFNYQTIPLDYTPSGHVTLMASVNNAQSEHFLFDTGVPVLMISSDYAKQLGIKTVSQAIIGKGSGGGDMIIYPSKIDKLTVGPVSSSPKQVLITNLQYAQVGVPLAGVIGLDWMQQHHAIIDMQRDVVYVR